MVAPAPSPRLPGYEVVRLIGRGGMGEVYEAIRIGPAGFKKSLAIKQLPSEKVIDGASVQRFLQEARISAQLDHPNIVRIHDLVVQDGYFLVMELLRGWNLNEAIQPRLANRAPVSWRSALELADQALAGLAYAHGLTDEIGRSLGLVHRDLTPRNLFLTESGGVKILDFGLAKLVNALTPGLTESGHLHGTLSFLAPEQARGEGSNPRSDLFQLGGVLYWLFSGRAPNGTGSAGEILARAANSRPAPLAELRPDLPRGVLAIVDRALARSPDERWPSADAMRTEVQVVLRDAGEQQSLAELAASLPQPPRPSPIAPQPPSTVSATLVRDQELPPTKVEPRPEPRERRPWILFAAATIAAVLGFLTSELRRGTPPPATPDRPVLPIYRRMTFRAGWVISARFTPSASSIVYSALWSGEPIETVEKGFASPEIRSLGLKGSEVAGIDARGKLALLTDASFIYSNIRKGTLAEAALSGGAPRERFVDIQCAEWTPTGELALLRWNGDHTTLELPPGNVLEAPAEPMWYGDLRISPDGRRIALVQHPQRYDDRGRVVVYDRETKQLEPLMEEWSSIRGLAWHPNGREIWFTGAEKGASHSLVALGLDRQLREVEAVPGSLTIFDVAADGRVLLSHELASNRVYFGAPGQPERDLSWFDFDAVFDIVADGSAYVFLQGASDASGADYFAYLRRTDGSAAVRLSEGTPWTISPDGTRVLITDADRLRMQLAPTRAGETHTLTTTIAVGSAAWFPDGKRILLGAIGPEPLRILDADTRAIATLPHRGLTLPLLGNPIAPDGRRFGAVDAKTGKLVIASLDGSELEAVPSGLPGEQVLRWMPDGKGVLVARLGDAPLQITRIELAGGKRSNWRTLMPSDPSGVVGVVTAAITPDLLHYVYTVTRVNGTLYLVENLR